MISLGRSDSEFLSRKGGISSCYHFGKCRILGERFEMPIYIEERSMDGMNDRPSVQGGVKDAPSQIESSMGGS